MTTTARFNQEPRRSASPNGHSLPPAAMTPIAGTITTAWTVNDVIRHFPMTILVFNDLGIDSCCGGMATLEAAARESSVAPHDLLAAIKATLVQEEYDVPVSWTDRLLRKIR